MKFDLRSQAKMCFCSFCPFLFGNACCSNKDYFRVDDDLHPKGINKRICLVFVLRYELQLSEIWEFYRYFACCMDFVTASSSLLR